MIEGTDHYPKLIIQELKGLNERMRYSNPDVTEFDFLRNCIPTQAGSLSKMNGCELYDTFSPSVASPILGITQTFDSAGNIIVQCRDAVYVITENELFGVSTPASALVRFTPDGSFAVTNVAATNPAQVTTGIAHGFTTGDWVIISGFTNGTFSVPINGTFQITVTSPTVFTVVSNCTVAPTDYSDTNVIETIDPAFNGDDELYPEALIVVDMVDLTSAVNAGYAESKQFNPDFVANARFIYNMNPDGSAANFILPTTTGSLIKLTNGRYRICAWSRVCSTSTNAFQLFMNVGGLGWTGSFSQECQPAIAILQNEILWTEGDFTVPSTANFAIYSQVRDAVPVFPARHYFNGKTISGFNIHSMHVKITKIS